MWISCLLIGSIICNLLQTDHVYAAPQGVYMPEWGYWSQDYYDPSQLPQASSSSDASQNTPEGNEFQGPSLDTLPYWGPGYDAGSPGYVDWYGAAFAPSSGGQWHASTGYGQKDELDQPVLSDVSQLDPVYSYDSGSRYKRGRVVYALSRYIPGEPSIPFGPFKKPSAKPNLKRPARPGY
ncbi:uncharacterized protein LOC144185644 [Stigmatopora nigra]